VVENLGMDRGMMRVIQALSKISVQVHSQDMQGESIQNLSILADLFPM